MTGRGIDDRDVVSDGIRKSISVENTFESDLETIEECLEKLPRLLEELNVRIGKNHSHGLIRKLVVKMKFSDFKSTSVERNSPCTDLNLLEKLIIEAWDRNPKAVRLLGVGVRLKETETISSDMQQLESELRRRRLSS
jgi:DNA polymerase-4